MLRSTSPGAKINEFLDNFAILSVGLKIRLFVLVED
jgi:hypothetical protein